MQPTSNEGSCILFSGSRFRPGTLIEWHVADGLWVLPLMSRAAVLW